jgi:hypothetical protein
MGIINNRAASPSTMGVKPQIQKVYDGRNVATRPIPLVIEASDARAIAAAAADSKPKAESVNWNVTNSLAAGAGTPTAQSVFGTRVSSGGDIMRSGVFNPATGTENFE